MQQRLSVFYELMLPSCGSFITRFLQIQYYYIATILGITVKIAVVIAVTQRLFHPFNLY